MLQSMMYALVVAILSGSSAYATTISLNAVSYTTRRFLSIVDSLQLTDEPKELPVRSTKKRWCWPLVRCHGGASNGRAPDVKAKVLPSNGGSRKYTVRENSLMCARGISSLNTILGCQVGVAAHTRD